MYARLDNEDIRDRINTQHLDLWIACRGLDVWPNDRSGQSRGLSLRSPLSLLFFSSLGPLLSFLFVGDALAIFSAALRMRGLAWFRNCRHKF